MRTRIKDHHCWNKTHDVSLTLWTSSGMNVVNVRILETSYRNDVTMSNVLLSKRKIEDKKECAWSSHCERNVVSFISTTKVFYTRCLIPPTFSGTFTVERDFVLTNGMTLGTIGWSPNWATCIWRLRRIRLFLPFCSNCSRRCCGGCRYLQGGSFLWHLPCNDEKRKSRSIWRHNRDMTVHMTSQHGNNTMSNGLFTPGHFYCAFPSMQKICQCNWTFLKHFQRMCLKADMPAFPLGKYVSVNARGRKCAVHLHTRIKSTQKMCGKNVPV